jgi:cephalosporin-C deacetylase-like acetyl esterase
MWALIFLAAAPSPLLTHMNTIAQQQLDRRDAAIAAVRTKAQAEARQTQVRAKILELIGGLPEYRGPLNARVTGRLTNPVYTLEKVIFESLPHYYVTANLYLPPTPGPHPAVLLSAGHSQEGKTENHRIAASLASKGFVALTYDPLGLGERKQTYDARIGQSIAGCCANEHLQAGAQAMLIGQSVARYFIFDAMRALDYIVSRREVDAERIGAAGCSGGGNVTTFVSALDPRIKAAAAACYLNSLRVLFTGPTPDSEMSMPRFVEAGLDHADFLEMVAPKPWLILATEGDFFTPAGAKIVYDEARRWYGLFGAEDRVRYFVGPGPHGTPLETREEISAWMIRWLAGGKGDPKEPRELPLYSDAELVVTASGQVENEPGSRRIHEVIREQFEALKRPRGEAELRTELKRMMGTGAPPVDLATKYYLPANVTGRRPGLLVVKSRTSEAVAEAAAEKGFVVLEMDPRDSPGDNDNRPYLGNWITNLRADQIGQVLPALRARDIVHGVDLLAARSDVDPARISATARDGKGVWLLMAAAVDSRITNIWLDRTAPMLASSLDQALNVNLFDALVPGFLLHWDLPDLVRMLGNRRLLWTEPRDWAGRMIPAAGAGFVYRKAAQTDEDFLVQLLR